MSKDIKKFIHNSLKKHLKEATITENYTSFENMINDENIVLNIIDSSLTIYDIRYLKSNDPVDGVLGCIGLNKNNGFYEVLRIAGNKGFGKIMYILGMEFANPLPIVIDREGDTRESAFNVIKKISETPPNGVKIKQLSPNDEIYEECLEWGCEEENPEFFKVYNTLFYSDKNYINKFKITNNKLIDNYAHEYFNGMLD